MKKSSYLKKWKRGPKTLGKHAVFLENSTS